MEILNASDPQALQEYESFVGSHPLGSFLQSPGWCRVKKNWRHAFLVSRDACGQICGSMLVLIKKFPFPLPSFLYSPWGPVCDLQNPDVLKDLIQGVTVLAKKYRAWIFKACPLVEKWDKETIQALCRAGLSYTPGLPDKKVIQCRHNYILPLKGRTPEDVFSSFKSKWRYNIRLAERKGVVCRMYGKEKLPEFYKLLSETAQRDKFTIRSPEYFASMMDNLGENCRLYLCHYQGIPLSGAITVQYGSRTCYVYGASTSLHREVMPNYLMQWTMIQWALENHCHTYDFMGIPFWFDPSHPNYGVYRFKQGFNGKVAVYAGEFQMVFSPGYKKFLDKVLGRIGYEKFS